METQVAFTIAIMNDLHVGVDAGGGFQNPFMTGDARQTVATTVAAINRHQPDLVLIPGDITSNAAEAELDEVQGYLRELECPIVVCKGNHDRETLEASQRFDAAFGERARAGLIQREDLKLPKGVAILVLESSWKHETPPYPKGPQPLAVLDEGLAELALDALDRVRPDWLLVVSHYPLVSQSQHAVASGLNYGGHIRDGAALMEQLVSRAGAVVCFCGHNHYHYIMEGDTWLQCATAAIAEYPAEYRLATIADGDLTISTHTGVQDIVRRANAPGCPQVGGRPEDREITWRPR